MTFDEFASGLADVTALPGTLTNHIFGAATHAAVIQTPLTKNWARKTPVLRLSAIPVVERKAAGAST